MKNYILEKKMLNNTDGRFLVVVEGETHMNRTIIDSDIQFFTTQGGYDYCHPYEDAKQKAQAIANGLNELERMKVQQNNRYPEYGERKYTLEDLKKCYDAGQRNWRRTDVDFSEYAKISNYK